MIQIGNIQLQGKSALAPMADFTDKVFREICKELGCPMTISEMTSAIGLVRNPEQTLAYVDKSSHETPYGVQIAGSDTEIMKTAARILKERNICDFIDINMGCPVKKVVGLNCGSAMLKYPSLITQIVEATVEGAFPLPVTVKIRAGWDSNCVNVEEVGEAVQKGGASAIAIHGRTRAQGYSGEANWDWIKRLKSVMSIPVFGNGDLDTAEKARRMMKYTGCDGVYIGRGAVANPWIFKEFESNQSIIPTPQEKYELIIQHVQKKCAYLGSEIKGCIIMRKHLMYYIRGMEGASQVRSQLSQIHSLAEMQKAIQPLFLQ